MKQKRTVGLRINSILTAASLDTLAVTAPTHAMSTAPKQATRTAAPESSRSKAFPQVIAPIVGVKAEAEAEAKDKAALNEVEEVA